MIKILIAILVIVTSYLIVYFAYKKLQRTAIKAEIEAKDKFEIDFTIMQNTCTNSDAFKSLPKDLNYGANLNLDMSDYLTRSIGR